ncbi:MAG: hypothetical protein DRQ47_02705, partial [Gammaproteobacteria bacterium]
MKKLILSKYKMVGLSLVELMVAMFVGMILIGGTASVYLASKRSYIEVERMARMTQNSRFAVQMVSEALIHAGYTGELPAGSIELDTNLGAIAGTDCAGAAAAYDIEHYMIAAVSDGSGAALDCITDAMPNTGVIVIKNVRPMRIRDIDPPDTDGVADGTIEGIETTNAYIMANNVRGILFDGADTAPTIVAGGDVPDGNAWIYQVQVYYVRDNGTDTPQLSRKILSWNGASMALATEDLIEGVENLSFMFGSDSNADG